MKATTTTSDELYGLRGVLFLWFPIVGPIAAWAVHILYLAAIARFTCNVPSSTWTMHAVTAACLAVCALALFLGWRLTRHAVEEGEDSTAGRHLFLGRLAMIVAVTNVLVILLEELYAIGFHPVRCAV